MLHSSSIDMNRSPEAVTGRWRQTTIPATRTRIPCGTRFRFAVLRYDAMSARPHGAEDGSAPSDAWRRGPTVSKSKSSCSQPLSGGNSTISCSVGNESGIWAPERGTSKPICQRSSRRERPKLRKASARMSASASSCFSAVRVIRS